MQKGAETQISELEARVTGSADSARVEALKADLVAARAEVAAVAALDELKAERRELVLDINAMGEEVDAHFKALQREEDRAIAAESRAAEAESRAAEAESGRRGRVPGCRGRVDPARRTEAACD